jgi:hypothetical protein
MCYVSNVPQTIMTEVISRSSLASRTASMSRFCRCGFDQAQNLLPSGSGPVIVLLIARSLLMRYVRIFSKALENISLCVTEASALAAFARRFLPVTREQQGKWRRRLAWNACEFRITTPQPAGAFRLARGLRAAGWEARSMSAGERASARFACLSRSGSIGRGSSDTPLPSRSSMMRKAAIRP